MAKKKSKSWNERKKPRRAKAKPSKKTRPFTKRELKLLQTIKKYEAKGYRIARIYREGRIVMEQPAEEYIEVVGKPMTGEEYLKAMRGKLKIT